MNKKYIWYLVFGTVILIVPTLIYLCFLIPQLKEEYCTLMASAGVIGTGGISATQAIPESWKYSKIFKSSGRAFVLLVVMTLIQEFYTQIIWLLITFLVSLIIFLILRELYRNGREAYRGKFIANEISRSISQNA